MHRAAGKDRREVHEQSKKQTYEQSAHARIMEIAKCRDKSKKGREAWRTLKRSFTIAMN